MSSAVAHRSRKKLPPELEGGLPFIGHALEFQRHPVRFLLRARERLGELFTFQLAGSNMALFTGPRANEAFFRAPEKQLNAKAAYGFTVPIFGKDIAYGASEERMEEQLELVVPALNERRLRMYATFINDEAENYARRMGERGEIDLLTLSNDLTVFNACRCLIGREFRENVVDEFARLYHDLEAALNLLGFFWPNLPLPAFKRRDRARRRLVEIITQIVADRRTRGSQEEDFLQTLMEAKFRDGSTLNVDGITGMLLTLIFAGQHTSAVLSAWTGVELFRHPEHLAAVVSEQERLLGNGEAVSFDKLREMPVLERSMRETERLHPPLMLLMRKVVSEFTYRDYRIPPGWIAMVSPTVSHLLPEVFPNPEQFDPDRFKPGREEDRKARFSLITFGGGKHGCIGMMFAYLQVKTMWSVLLRRFEFDLVTDDIQPNYSTFVVGPKQPCLVRYRRKL